MTNTFLNNVKLKAKLENTDYVVVKEDNKYFMAYPKNINRSFSNVVVVIKSNGNFIWSNKNIGL